MDGTASKSTATAPFLLKTYDMVDDSITDEIVSWSSTRNSFIVWNPPEFSRLLLPTYFKHNNFSSFIRQLNTYGFRKIDPERWEFANEYFVKDQKHLLKNIFRRKPIHSHSNTQGSTIDPERVVFEEEIDKLTQEKAELEKSLSRFQQQQPTAKVQIDNLTQRIDSVEQRQNNLLMFLEKAVHNPGFVDLLSQNLESMDFSAYNKKRRLPSGDKSQMVLEDVFVDNGSPYRPEFGNVFHHDFANKLKLELSSTVSDMVSQSPQSSNEDVGRDDARMTPGGLPLAPEIEMLDSDMPFNLNMDSSLVHKAVPCEIPSCFGTNEEAEGHISCLLNLSLASGVSEVINAGQSTDRMVHSIEEIGKPSYLSGDTHNEVPANNQVLGPPVNDVFWEQFLTERPVTSGVEASSKATNLQNLNL